MAGNYRISSLDGLRGIAASAVVFSHFDMFYKSDNIWLSRNDGDEAVAIFFALSGFLMAMLYGDRKFSPADYLVHRFARIYPVYIAAVVCVVLLTAIPGVNYIDHISGFVSIARHALMIGSVGVFWSIPPEIQFYVFFLAVWLWFSDPAKYQWIAILTAAFLIVAAFFGFPGPGILLTSKLPYFLFGTMAGRIFTLYENRPTGYVAGIACLSLLAFFLLARGLFPSENAFWGLSSAFTAAVIVYLAACSNVISAIVLGSSALVFVGRISFSLYLFHVPVIFLGMRMLSPFVPAEIALSLSVIVAYLFAWMCNLAIEEPCRKFLTEQWRQRKQAPERLALESSLIRPLRKDRNPLEREYAE